MPCEILTGDCREILPTLPAESVHCVVTSPPYWGLRAYEGGEGMIGLEPTLEAHLDNMVAVFREVRRVLRSDGTLWLNYGDAYANDGKWGGSTGGKHAKGLHGQTGIGRRKVKTGFKPKDLMMMPARLALALQADGWWLRSEIIWAKKNSMPESAKDRPSNAHEKIYLLSKSVTYFYDYFAVRRRPASGPADIRKMRESKARIGGKHKELDDPLAKASAATNIGRKRSVGDPSAANLRNVWRIATYSFRGAHFAVMPPALVEPCVKAGSSGGGVCAECGAPRARVVEKAMTGRRGKPKRQETRMAMKDGNRAGDYSMASKGWEPTCGCDAEIVPARVLDPFGGAGTVGLVAERLQRDSILIEISPEYAAMAAKRIREDAPLFTEVETDARP